MRIKRAIFICCLLLALVSMASVSASDIDVQSSGSSLGVLVSSGDDVEDVQSSGGSLDDDLQEVQSNGDSSDDDNVPDKVASSNENNVLKASFNDLQSIIDSAHDGDVIELDRDYSFQEGGSTF